MSRHWEVVGGEETGGLVVREGQGLASRKAGERLATGAVVEEVQLVAERLQFRLLSGLGPHTGWVSTSVKGKELLRLYGPSADEAAPARGEAAPPKAAGQQGKLTREQAWAMQKDLLQAYSGERFQQRLLERWKAAGPDMVAQAKARQEVCLEVQGPIIAKYGFESSRKGVALSVNAFRAPELLADPELAARNAKLGWLADPGQRPENQVQAQAPPPPPAPRPDAPEARPKAGEAAGERPAKAAAAVTLTREQASAMQDELIAGYSKSAFQSKLHAAWKGAGDSPQQKSKVRKLICLEVQGPIVAKYGFDASMEGVMYSLMAFSAPHIIVDLEIQAKNQHMLFLINPDEQAKYRKCGRVRIWSSSSEGAALVEEVSVDLADDVRSLKRQIEASAQSPWHTQRLWLGECELEDHWRLESVVPQDGVSDVVFQARRPEVASWLARLADGPETRTRSSCLASAPPELLADAELLLPLVSVCRWALLYAAPALKADRRIVEAALRHSGGALEHASEDLRADRELVLLAVAGERGDAWALQFAAAELRADREVVERAVQKDGWALQFASEAMRADREIVLQAAKREGWVLSTVAKELQADREVVLAAIKQNWEVLEVAPPELRADREVVLAAVRQDGWALEFAAPTVQADREVVLVAVCDVGEALRFATPELQTDREVAMAAISADGLSISLVPQDLHDFEMVLAAVSKDLRALQWISETFRSAVLEALGFKGEDPPPFMGMPNIRTGRIGGSDKSSANKQATLTKHFATMGLDQGATVSQIRKRYRALALEHHPDKNPEDPQAAKEKFQVVNDAYQYIKEALGF